MEKAKRINKMFSSIAEKYDLLNTILSLNRDKSWRKFVAKLCIGECLDIATGTGELAFECLEYCNRVVGLDISEKMLKIAKEKSRKRNKTVTYVLGVAEKLPFKDKSFDCTTMAFALRNVSSIEDSIREMVRVSRKKVIILEFSKPRNRIIREFYFKVYSRFIPIIGGLISKNKEAYEYLPNSIENFIERDDVIKIMEDSGLRNIKAYELTLGVVTVYVGEVS